MPKIRKKKIPITLESTIENSSSNPRASRTLIRQFHVLLKRQAQLQSLCSSHGYDAEYVKALEDVQQRIDALGGLGAYQRMSCIGQGNDRGGGSEKVLIGWLKEMGMTEIQSEAKNKLRLLEVGALKPDNYLSYASWIESTPIDLKSRHPSIKEQDFLLMSATEHCESWDVISLSLVLNFVPNPKDRGRMLCLAHSILAREGLLFLVLPLPCLLNSRYLTLGHLRALMQVIGFAQVEEKWKEGGKMGYWLYRKAKKLPALNIYESKAILRQGNRNNFAILL